MIWQTLIYHDDLGREIRERLPAEDPPPGFARFVCDLSVLLPVTDAQGNQPSYGKRNVPIDADTVGGAFEALAGVMESVGPQMVHEGMAELQRRQQEANRPKLVIPGGNAVPPIPRIRT